jgi:cobalt-precorrin-5B (C1)-methyltransferase
LSKLIKTDNLKPKLKKGYTTGVHTSFAFKSALSTFKATGIFCISYSKKIDNDDLDVTKQCVIFVQISNKIEDISINKISHKPFIFKYNNKICKIYASNGLGVVTKKGLKTDVGYPAINPKPLQVLKELFKKNPINCVCSIVLKMVKK